MHASFMGMTQQLLTGDLEISLYEDQVRMGSRACWAGRLWQGRRERFQMGRRGFERVKTWAEWLQCPWLVHSLARKVCSPTVVR